MAKSKDLTKKIETTEIAIPDYSKHAGVGFENQTQDDVKLPFIALLQDGSPQVKTSDPKRIDGAEAGMIFNTVTGEVYGKEIEFIPGFLERVVVEWVNRNRGGSGGFVTKHPGKPEDCEIYQRGVKEAGTKFTKIQNPDNPANDLVETVYMYGLVSKKDASPDLAVIAFTSTKLDTYTTWNTRRGMFQTPTAEGRKVEPPIYSHRIRIGSKTQTNARNQTFWNFTMYPFNGEHKNSMLDPGDPRFEAAENLHKMVEAGTATVDEASQNVDTTPADGDGAF